MKIKLYTAIDSTLRAIENCKASGNTEWYEKHHHRLGELQDELPSGSGVDCGTRIDYDNSKPDRFALVFDYHHMDEHGGYCGWTTWRVFVTPTFLGDLDLCFRIMNNDTEPGRDFEADLEYWHDLFHGALTQEVGE